MQTDPKQLLQEWKKSLLGEFEYSTQKDLFSHFPAENPQELLENLLLERKEVLLSIPPPPLFREVDQFQRERGSTLIYITYGILDSKYPFLFIPVQIRQKEKQIFLQGTEHDPFINPLVIEKKLVAKEVSSAIEKKLSQGEWKSIILNFKSSDFIKELTVDFSQDLYFGVFYSDPWFIYQDLKKILPRIQENDRLYSIFQSSALEINTQEEANLEKWVEIEKKVDLNKISPLELFPIASFDGSQLKAMLAARQKVSFIIDGPSGSGKTQTLANILSNAIAEGKKVLVVSPVIKSLSSLESSLEKAGLDDFIMDLYTGSWNRNNFAEKLQVNLTRQHGFTPFDENRAAEILELQGFLAACMDSLHKKRSQMDLSIQQAIGYLDPVQYVENSFAEFEDVFAISKKQFGHHLDELNLFYQQYEKLKPVEEYFFRDSKRKDFSFHDQEKCKTLLKKMEFHLSKELVPACQSLIEIFGDEWGPSIDNFEWYVEIVDRFQTIPPLPAEWLNTEQWPDLYEIVKTFQTKQQGLKEKAELILSHYKTLEIPEEQLLECLTVFLHAEKYWFYQIPFVFPRFEQAKKIFSQYQKQKKFSLKTAIPQLRFFLRFKKEYNVFLSNLEKAESIFGSVMNPLDSDIGIYVKYSEELQETINLYPQVKESAVFENLIIGPRAEIEKPIQKGKKVLEEYIGWMQELEKLVALEAGHFQQNFFTGSVETLVEHIRTYESHIDSLKDWSLYLSQKEKLEKSGILSYAETYVDSLDRRAFIDGYKKSFYVAWLGQAMSESSIMSKFQYEEFQEKVRWFSQLDRDLIDLGGERVKEVVMDKYPTDQDPRGDITFLKTELLQNKSTHSIKSYFHEVFELITELYPCVFTTPSQVSEYLPAEANSFDLVIIQNAGQVSWEEVIPSFFRAKQQILCGDRLMDWAYPSEYSFQLHLGLVKEEQEERSNASALQKCMAVMKFYPLQWQYRIQQEELFAFINKEYYQSSINSFPSSSVTEENSALKLFVTSGITEEFTKGLVNQQEAEAICNRFIELEKSQSFSSIGIITLTRTQRDYIRETLVARLEKEFPDKNFYQKTDWQDKFIRFVDDCHEVNYQAVLFSVVYGKKPNTLLQDQFPIFASDLGRQRLILALTRASQHLDIFVSFYPHEFEDNHLQNPSLQNFLHFLNLAENSLEEILSSKNELSPVFFPLQNAIYRRLSVLGYEVHFQIGLSQNFVDLAVVDPNKPGKYLLGINCYSSIAQRNSIPRMQHIIKNKVLTEQGWELEKVWATEWLERKEEILEKIQKKLETLQRQTHE